MFQGILDFLHFFPTFYDQLLSVYFGNIRKCDLYAEQSILFFIVKLTLLWHEVEQLLKLLPVGVFKESPESLRFALVPEKLCFQNQIWMSKNNKTYNALQSQLQRMCVIDISFSIH